MKLRTPAYTFLILCFGFICNAQISSVGMSFAALDYKSDSGSHVSGNQFGFKLRCQIHKKLYWNAGGNFAKLNDKSTQAVVSSNVFGNSIETTTTTQSEYFHAYSGLEYPALAFGKVTFWTSIEWGAIKDADDYYAMLQGEVTLETNITEKIAIGFPITYSFVTWKRDTVASLGLRAAYRY